jgi:radical SAM enzyme (rSAM/lipoprotein system)
MTGKARHISLRKRMGLEIQRIMQRKLTKEHPLYQLFWECTLRCNMHCRHCGSDCKNIADTKDMPREDFFRVLDSIAEKTDPGKTFVILTGGEPLMRDDIELCGKGIFDRGFPWGIVTNGLFLDERKFAQLMDAGMNTVAMSLDGLKDNHNWMRGNKDSFDCADKAIDIMVNDEWLMFDIVTSVTEKNFSQLPQIKEYLINKGVKLWRLDTVFPVGRAANDKMLQLTDKHFVQLMNFIHETRKEGLISASFGCEGFMGGYEGDVRDYAYFCRAGITVGSVLADGSISACTSIRSDYHQGNIYSDDFMDVWNNKFEVYRNKEWARKGKCAGCDMFRYCKGNGMHLRNDKGELLMCHLERLINGEE